MKTGVVTAVIDLNEPDEALRPLTEFRPIGTLPFAGRYRLIDFPLSAIDNASIKSVGLFLPRSGRSVQDHLRSGAAWNLDALQGGVFTFPYIAEKDYDSPIVRSRYYDDYIQFLRKSDTQYTVIMGTSNVANIDINAVMAYHRLGNSRITTVYKQVNRNLVEANDWTLELSELGTTSSVVLAKNHHGDPNTEKLPLFMDVYFLETQDLIDMLVSASEAPNFRHLSQLLREAVLENNANAFEYTGYLSPITSIPRYFAANMAMLDENNYQALLFSSRPIQTKSKNEVPTFLAGDSRIESSLLGTGGYIEGEIDHSVIFRNVVVHRDAVVSHSIIMQGSKVSAGSTVRYAILDKGVVIGPNLTLEGTPEKPLIFSKNQRVFQAQGVRA
ncbi:glucose-1-phosphate adenylyltransferase subunit GlgD [Lacticaseibacillus brantae]|uniref:ADP-glucose pyrophosphorylase n=1 Tax=Lacticaseibacillus brantae DSM 23927 TaxID=1423727 RepID=A0A0R2AYM0_9LACO|nr:glucose-1-phosphate adenylyltransferase subunit GlgD [Lacticaseibacillus brantae]KRM72183.1 ADP-glucose pyrophosphorylase [Lacticaseibacillus brantae DSM 23927]